MKKLMAVAALVAVLVVGAAAPALADGGQQRKVFFSVYTVDTPLAQNCRPDAPSWPACTPQTGIYHVELTGYLSSSDAEAKARELVECGLGQWDIYKAYKPLENLGSGQGHDTNTRSDITFLRGDLFNEGECYVPEPSVYRVGAKMQRGEPVAPLFVTCSDGRAQVTYTRAPGFLSASIDCYKTDEGGYVKFRADPRHSTVMRISGPGLSIETWSRVKGADPITRIA